MRNVSQLSSLLSGPRLIPKLPGQEQLHRTRRCALKRALSRLSTYNSAVIHLEPNRAFLSGARRHYSAEAQQVSSKDESSELTDHQQVFLTFKPLLERKNILGPRKISYLKAFIINHRDAAPSLIEKLGVPRILRILSSLLWQGAFSSEARAKSLFPSLFETSSAEYELRRQSEIQANESEAKALREADVLDQETSEPRDTKSESEPAQSNPENSTDDGNNPSNGNNQSTPKRKGLPTVNYAAFDSHLSPNTIPGTRIRSLYPSYVPYKVQHLILTKVQTLLEESCYEFTVRWIPSLLEEKEWRCPQAVELNRWTASVYNRVKKLPPAALDNKHSTDLQSVFASLCGLRHAAVHRIPVSVRGIDDMIHNAIMFFSIIRDLDRECQLIEIHLELKRIVRSQELYMNFLENRLQRELAEIKRAREELEKRQTAALFRMQKENTENQRFIGEILQDSMVSIFDGQFENESPHLDLYESTVEKIKQETEEIEKDLLFNIQSSMTEEVKRETEKAKMEEPSNMRTSTIKHIKEQVKETKTDIPSNLLASGRFLAEQDLIISGSSAKKSPIPVEFASTQENGKRLEETTGNDTKDTSAETPPGLQFSGPTESPVQRVEEDITPAETSVSGFDDIESNPSQISMSLDESGTTNGKLHDQQAAENAPASTSAGAQKIEQQLTENSTTSSENQPRDLNADEKAAQTLPSDAEPFHSGATGQLTTPVEPLRTLSSRPVKQGKPDEQSETIILPPLSATERGKPTGLTSK